MRILVDMQGAQTESRFRGIGRYTINIAKAMAKHCDQHEVIFALNGSFCDSINPIKTVLEKYVSSRNIVVWNQLNPVKCKQAGNDMRRAIAELLRNHFLSSFNPEVILITSLFEGFIDDAVTTTDYFSDDVKVAAIFYDLIPLVNKDLFLSVSQTYADFYMAKINNLKQLDLILGISEATLKEGRELLKIPEDKLFNIKAASEDYFFKLSYNKEEVDALYERFGIKRSFVLYCGGFDPHKNVERMVRSFACLPLELRKGHHLLLAGGIGKNVAKSIYSIAKRAGLKDKEVLFTYRISNSDLRALYNLCSLFIYPSWHEGFGLPVLEAMSCGAPVIASNRTSIPEVVGRDDILFDPFDEDDIRGLMEHLLNNEKMRMELRAYGLLRAKEFSWDISAKLVYAALDGMVNSKIIKTDVKRCQLFMLSSKFAQLINAIADVLSRSEWNDEDIELLSATIAKNMSLGWERQILIDITELCQHIAYDEICALMNSLEEDIVDKERLDISIEPVIFNVQEGFRYARYKVASEPCSFEESDLRIFYQEGDILYARKQVGCYKREYDTYIDKLKVAGVMCKNQ